MMNGREKSDSAIVARKPANNAGKPAAEWVEPRAGTKRNTGQSHTCRAQNRASVSQGLDRVRQAARQRKKERFTALLHHVTIDRLRASFFALKRNAAPGVDGLTCGTTRQDWKTTSSACTREYTVERTGHYPYGDSTYRSRMANSARWGLPRWKTRSSSARWSKC